MSKIVKEDENVEDDKMRIINKLICIKIQMTNLFKLKYISKSSIK